MKTVYTNTDHPKRIKWIRTTKANADKMTARILAANPTAEIKHANYI